MKNIHKILLAGMGALSLSLVGCGGGGGDAAASGPTAGTAGTQPHSAASLTLAVKFVEFKDSSGNVPLTQDQAAQVVNGINQMYAQCGMAVKLDQYQQVDPASLKLPSGLASMDQLDPIRSAFDDPKELVVINTGAWDHGSMGSANAWTAMPGQNPSGAVIEGPVASDAPIVAHELGHYLGLDHVSNQADMMNPIIYPTSILITQDQCQTMQDTARGARVQALR